MKVLGIDIGGSAVKGAPVDTATGRLLAPRHRIATPDAISPQQMAEAIAEIARHFKWQGPMGVGFPGVTQGPFIRTSANLHPKFVNCDAVKLFAKVTGCPVALTNDAAVAAQAEMKFGAGRGFAGKTLLLTLGTGVGTALAQQGVVVPAELGHFPMKGKSAERFVSAAAKTRKNLSWKKWGTQLGQYIATLEMLFWPELIIIGGGVSADHGKFFKYLGTRAKLVPAEFFNEAGIVGAALHGVPRR